MSLLQFHSDQVPRTYTIRERGTGRALVVSMATRKAGQGSKWIRQSTRLAIYLRDGMCCAYCGATIEDGAQLSLDHLTPCHRGGQNNVTNLVTCCKRCNSSRQDRPVRTFCRAVSEYLGRDAGEIERHVRACARRQLPRAEARELIARRGYHAALKG